MKTIFITFAFMSCLFVNHVEARQQTITKNKQAAVLQNERQILLDNCWIIRTRIAEYFAGMGALQSSGYQNTIKQEITNYLNSVGSSTSLQLLNEIKANGFKDYI